MLKEKILFDTDIGSDIDDAVALAYLLAQEKCELMGITTVSGQACERAQMADAMLRVFGREDVPVLAGAQKPLLTKVMQPLAPQADSLTRWEHSKAVNDRGAIEFMYDTICKNPGEVTLLAVGPMTNAALLFAQYPQAAQKLKRIVLMNGKFFGELRGEWNSINDPYATKIVYAANSPVHRSIGLDVTMRVQLPPDEVKRRFTDPRLAIVADFASVWFANTNIMTFHDPLAAVSIFRDDIVTYKRGDVDVDISARMGWTYFNENENGAHEVGYDVDAAKFFDEYFSVFG